MSCDKPDDSTTTNIELLRRHLKNGTLAARLVDAYRASGPEERSETLKDIARTRLAEIRAARETERMPNASD